jgi:hypothetical protein
MGFAWVQCRFLLPWSPSPILWDHVEVSVGYSNQWCVPAVSQILASHCNSCVGLQPLLHAWCKSVVGIGEPVYIWFFLLLAFALRWNSLVFASPTRIQVRREHCLSLIFLIAANPRILLLAVFRSCVSASVSCRMSCCWSSWRTSCAASMTSYLIFLQRLLLQFFSILASLASLICNTLALFRELTGCSQDCLFCCMIWGYAFTELFDGNAFPELSATKQKYGCIHWTMSCPFCFCRRSRSQSCPFCRDSLMRVNSGDLWMFTESLRCPSSRHGNND